jgi:uncharacterized protein with von Willebrand factor type A (vWA) domain
VEKTLQEHDKVLDEHESILKDHEKRLITMEICYRNSERKIDDLKSEMVRNMGRIEKSVDTLSDKLGNESSLNSSTRGQIAMVLAVATPIIVIIVGYFFK